MAEQELLERPRYQDYPQGRKDPAYHEAIARWNAQQRDEEYVPLDTQIERQLAEDANFMEVSELSGNIPALSDSNTYGSDGTAPVEYIETAGYPLNPTYSDYSINKQGTSLSDYATPQGAGGAYAEQQMQEQRQKEFEEDAVAENVRQAELTDYERIQESYHNPNDIIPLRQQNVNGLYAAYQAGNKPVFSAGFNASTSQDKISFYHKLYEDGTLEKEDYKNIVASQLQLDNPDMVYYFDDGDLFTMQKNPNEIGDNSHGQVVLFPTDIPSEGLIADENGNFLNSSISPTPLVAQDTGLSTDDKFTWTVGGTLAAVDPLDDDSTWVRDVRPVVNTLGRIALGVLTGGQSETWYSLYKVANGETLHGSDYFNLIVAGLETTGMIAPPSTTIDPVTGVETVNAGFGLGTLDYDTTVDVLRFMGDGDIVNAALAYAGNDFNILESTFEGLGITNETFGLDVQDWDNILDKTQEAGFAGDSMTDMFEREVGKDYLSMGEDALKEIIPDGATPDWVDTLVNTAEEAGRVIDDNIIQPIIAPVKPIIEDVETVGRTIDDKVIQPVIEAGEQVLSTAEDVLEPVKEVVETVGEPIVDVVDEIIDTVDSPLGDLLEGALSGISGTGGMMAGTRQPTQVEGIFDKELFKFDTEIKSTQEMLSPMMNLRRYG